MAATVLVPMVNGTILRLPLGFKFSPSDEELVVQYLRCRAVDKPLPCAIIIDRQIMQHNPWDLVPEGAKEKYLFTRKEPKYSVGRRTNRAAGEGYWRATGTGAPVYAKMGSHKVLVGMKKSLMFYRGKAPAGERTNWGMHEYRLAGAGLKPYRVMRRAGRKTCGCAAAAIAKKNYALAAALGAVRAKAPSVPVMVNPDDSWVVCHIYKKNLREPRLNDQPAIANTSEGNGVPFIDFLAQGNHELSRNPSCITDTLEKEQCGSGGNKKAASDRGN